MSKICTDLEQSRKLVELGIEPNTADMYFEPSVGFRTEPSEIKVGDIKNAHPRSVPAWSLSALLQLMPITCDVIKDFHNRYYCSNKFDDNDFDTWHLTTSCENPIDAAVEMVVWLLKNGYIKD